MVKYHYGPGFFDHVTLLLSEKNLPERIRWISYRNAFARSTYPVSNSHCLDRLFGLHSRSGIHHMVRSISVADGWIFVILEQRFGCVRLQPLVWINSLWLCLFPFGKKDDELGHLPDSGAIRSMRSFVYWNRSILDSCQWYGCSSLDLAHFPDRLGSAGEEKKASRKFQNYANYRTHPCLPARLQDNAKFFRSWF